MSTIPAPYERRKCATYALGELLPGLPALNNGQTRAPGPVWTGSTTKNVGFHALPKKQAARIWHKARAFDRATHQRGRHGGIVGRTALLVLHTLLFEFLNYRTGQLDPSYDGIARRSGICRRAVATALKRLKSLGMLNWLRRAHEGRDDAGRFVLKQDTNAYAVLPPSQWLGYREPPGGVLDPSEWGAVPPLPDLLHQACDDLRHGDSIGAAAKRLLNDAGDPLASSIASYYASVKAYESKHFPECS